MKRNLIALIAILGLAANAAFAEPTLSSDENVLKSAPEATSFVAGSRGAIVEITYPFNP
jgi:hypothetical protein